MGHVADLDCLPGALCHRENGRIQMVFFRTEHAQAIHEGMRLDHGAYAVLVVSHEVAWSGDATLAAAAVVELAFHAALAVGPVGSWLVQRSEKPNCWRQHTIRKLD